MRKYIIPKCPLQKQADLIILHFEDVCGYIFGYLFYENVTE